MSWLARQSGFRARRSDSALEHDALGNLVISDYVMPGFFGGLEALELCKTTRGGGAVHYRVRSYLVKEVAVAALKAGANDYVMKDRLARLGPAVERAIAGKNWIARGPNKARPNEALRENEARFAPRLSRNCA